MVATILMIFLPIGGGTSLPGGATTTLGGGTAISGSGTTDTGGRTLFRPVPAEFNHWFNLSVTLVHFSFLVYQCDKLTGTVKCSTDVEYQAYWLGLRRGVFACMASNIVCSHTASNTL